MSGDKNRSILQQELVPFLPDDVALQCLLRVPVQAHSQLQGVCKKWRELVSSSEFYERRKKEGTTGHCVCLLQALPEDASQHHPLFSVSILNEKQLWERLPPIPGFGHDSGLPLFARLAAVGGNLVVIGGWHPSTMAEVRSVYIFSFSSWTWRRGADMPTTRSFFACAVLHSHILVAGGHDRNKNALRSAERYNLERDLWETLPDMAVERDECAGAVLDGKLVVISGYTTSSQGEFRRDAETYDPVLNTWTQTLNMWAVGSKAISPSNIVAIAGKLFAFHHSQLVCYSPRANLWQVVDSLPEGARGISFAASATGFGNSIIVTGPSSAEDGSHRTLVYSLPESMMAGSSDEVVRCQGRWEMVPVDDHFRGIAHVSCAVEV